MISHETINQRYSELQQLLRETYGGDGRGIVEILRAVEPPPPYQLSLELRLIALLRNEVVHEGRVEVPRYFEPLAKCVIAELKRLKKEKKSVPPKKKATVTTAAASASTVKKRKPTVRASAKKTKRKSKK